MWEIFGKRCEGDQFEEIYRAAIQTYKYAGLL
jgi:hypothetical protein